MTSPGCSVLPEAGKSFLVLFFKKELLFLQRIQRIGSKGNAPGPIYRNYRPGSLAQAVAFWKFVFQPFALARIFWLIVVRNLLAFDALKVT